MVGKAKHTQSICTNPPDLTHFMAALQVIPGMVLELNVEKNIESLQHIFFRKPVTMATI